VYGRRKVGKTWLVTRCLDWSVYVLVSRGGVCWVDEGRGLVERSIDEALRRVAEVLMGGGTAVIDEFQRLPGKYWDYLASLRGSAAGRLVLCSSSLGVARRVFGPGSPLLGVLNPFHVDIAAFPDTVASLSSVLDPVEAVLWGVVARDPWILSFIEPGGDPVRALALKASGLVMAASGLIGGVFEEEERQLTRLYDAVLRLLARGVWSSKALAARLHSASLISSPSPGIVTGVLSQLESMGLVAKVRLWRTRGARYYYKHRSPLLSVLYSVADLVDELAAARGVEDAIRRSLDAELRFSIGELLAERSGAVQAYTMLPSGKGGVDVVLLARGRRLLAVYEVKTGTATRSDAESLKRRAELLGVPMTGIVALRGAEPGVEELVDEVLDAEGVVEEARRLAGRAAAGQGAPQIP